MDLQAHRPRSEVAAEDLANDRSGGGSNLSEGEGASGEAAQVTETKAEIVVELNRIELSAS